jgi:hypothetical protein
MNLQRMIVLRIKYIGSPSLSWFDQRKVTSFNDHGGDGDDVDHDNNDNIHA